MPRLASTRRDAAALAVYLLWKNPGGHMVTSPLTRERSNALIAQVADAARQDDPAAAVTSSGSSPDPDPQKWGIAIYKP